MQRCLEYDLNPQPTDHKSNALYIPVALPRHLPVTLNFRQATSCDVACPKFKFLILYNLTTSRMLSGKQHIKFDQVNEFNTVVTYDGQMHNHLCHFFQDARLMYQKNVKTGPFMTDVFNK